MYVYIFVYMYGTEIPNKFQVGFSYFQQGFLKPSGNSFVPCELERCDNVVRLQLGCLCALGCGVPILNVQYTTEDSYFCLCELFRVWACVPALSYVFRVCACVPAFVLCATNILDDTFNMFGLSLCAWADMERFVFQWILQRIVLHDWYNYFIFLYKYIKSYKENTTKSVRRILGDKYHKKRETDTGSSRSIHILI